MGGMSVKRVILALLVVLTAFAAFAIVDLLPGSTTIGRRTTSVSREIIIE